MSLLVIKCHYKNVTFSDKMFKTGTSYHLVLSRCFERTVLCLVWPIIDQGYVS